MRIGFVTFGASWNTFGLKIITDEIKRNFNIICEPAKIENANQFDVLLFSLYWWEHKYDYIKFIFKAGLKPHSKKPYLILGGMDMMTPKPLSGFFDYAVIGDGEDVITELLQDIIDKKIPTNKAVWIDGEENKCEMSVKKTLYAERYIEDRTNKTVRVEIARGCKRKCLFCMVSFMKPYRELPAPAVKQLIMTSPTKSISLFAPDTASYSDYEAVEYWVAKYGKRNTGTDLRLDTVFHKKTASALRFGIEGFSERIRLAIGKPYTNEKLLSYFEHILTHVKNNKGKNLTTATAYMILGLPNETFDGYYEFNRILAEINKMVKDKFTLFLTFNGFSAQPFTPLQFARVDVFGKFLKEWNSVRTRHDKLVIAQHGGSRNPSSQIMQMLAIRGDENSSKILYNLAVNPNISSKAIGNKPENAKYLLRLLESQKIDPSKIIGELDYNDALGWDGIKNIRFPKEKLWKMFKIYNKRTL